jgi:CheY-like chemotaxis protein
MTTEDVVIVDDHTDSRDGVKQLLELDGYNVRASELARQLPARYGAETVLVVLTGSTKPEEIAPAEMTGADYILRKPLDIALLGRMLPLT